jgi:hypothetical protein
VYITETAKERIANTLVWYPSHVAMPKTSSAAARDLIYTLQNPAAPIAPLADDHRKGLQNLSEIFQQVTTHPEPAPRVRFANNQPNLPTTAGYPRVPPSGTAFTYAGATRNRGQFRRELARQNKQPTVFPAKPILTSNRFAPLVDDPPTNVPEPVQPPSCPTNASARRRPKVPATPAPKSSPIARRPEPHRHNTRTKQRYRKQQHVSHVFTEPVPPAFPEPMANSVSDPNTGASLEYRHLIKGPDAERWQQANMIEINQLTDGRLIKGSTGTQTISFIAQSKLPKHKKATNLRVLSNYRPSKVDPYQVRWTVGGNKIEYAGDTSTSTADLTTAELVFNSVVSTPNAEFATSDISDFYLFTDMDECEYMWIPIQFLNPEVMAAYELDDIIVDERVLAKISKGMYGLPQAGRLAYNQLVLNLGRNGYHPCKRTHGLWRHVTRPVLFSLVVDDFGIKYVGKQHAQHLFTSLRENYKISEDWTGELYLGIKLNWDYKNRTVDLSMPNYVSEALHRFQHPAPYRPEHAPHDWTKPAYGQRQQFVTPHDDSDLLDQDGINRVQQVVGMFL